MPDGSIFDGLAPLKKDNRGFDLKQLLIGSEGTLAIITEATLKLTPKPPCVAGVAAHFRDLASCSAAIVAIMGQPFVPSALEFLDNNALTLLRNHYPDMLPPESAAMLMIEVDGSPQDVANAQQAIVAACQAEGLIEVAAIAQPQALWAARKALSPLLRDVAPKKINEDVVVPVSRVPELIARLQVISKKHDIPIVTFGHAGNGNIHVNLLYQPERTDQVRNAPACLSEVFDAVLDLDGTLSGEHGIGLLKREFLPRAIDPVALELMHAIKRQFDPAGILNPGKLLP